MAIAVQGRRGTTVEHSDFAGLDGEYTIDVSKKSIVIHDGITPGGHPLARENLATSPTFVGGNGVEAGIKGLVPAPAIGDTNKFLKGDGTWSILPISKVSHANALYVAKDGSDGLGDGSIAQPFVSIQKAIDTAVDDQVIFIQPGIYTEDLTVLGKRVFIRSYNPIMWSNTRIDGKVSVGTASSLFMSAISIRNPGTDVTDYCLDMNNTSYCRFDNVAFIKPNLDVAIKITGSQPSNVIFTAAYVEGIVKIAGSQEQTIKFFQVTSTNTKFDLMGTNGVTIEDCAQIGTVTHESGLLYMRNVGYVAKTAGNSIVSSAPLSATNMLLLNNVNLQQEDLSYGFISKTGDCIWAFNAVVRDVSNDVLTGSRYTLSTNAADINANRTAVNYTTTDASLVAHLNGIDSALGDRAKVTDLSPVALTGKFSDLTDVPNFTADYNDLLNKPSLGTASERNAGFNAGEVPYLDADGKLNANVIPNAFNGTIAAANVTVDASAFNGLFDTSDTNLQSILEKLDQMNFGGGVTPPTFPNDIDGGTSSTTTFDGTINGGTANSTFTDTFDGGNA